MSSLVLVVLGVVVRAVAVFSRWFITRPEVATPLNSWTRLTEGVHLFKSGFSPYSGVVFHETPLALGVFSVLGCDPKYVSWLFITADLVTSFLLAKVGEIVANKRLSEEDAAMSSGCYHHEAKPLLANLTSLVTLPRIMTLAYLLNPYTIASCAGLTTTVWSNLLLSCFLFCLLTQRTGLASVSLALASYQSLYPVLLVVPLCLTQSRHVVVSILLTFTTTLAALLLLSKEIAGDWQFLNSVYGFILTVPELTPNMGIFWYFFTEMFDHFRLFFICTFQFNLVLYVAPLAIKFPQQPLLLSVILIGLTAVFKSFPGLGDVGFFLALLPLFSNLLHFMKQTFIVICMLIFTSVLAPIAWQLWIYNNSANANYYFAINLAYSTAQIFLITDLLFGHVKREFFLKNGFSLLEKEDENGDKPILTLK